MADSIGIGIGIALIGLGIVGMIFSGIRSMINGKSELKRIAVMLVPVIIFAISYFSMGDINRAGIATLTSMILLMVLSIFISGTRGTFKI
ncbi:MAG TPA: hypothetical protein VK040_00565 [Balneolaceae bacterium]|nr:hypothetical protein [Balneolaceae bacterium]